MAGIIRQFARLLCNGTAYFHRNLCHSRTSSVVRSPQLTHTIDGASDGHFQPASGSGARHHSRLGAQRWHCYWPARFRLGFAQNSLRYPVPDTYRRLSSRVLLPCLVTVITAAREMKLSFALRMVGRQMSFAAIFSLCIAWTGWLFYLL